MTTNTHTTAHLAGNAPALAGHERAIRHAALIDAVRTITGTIGAADTPAEAARALLDVQCRVLPLARNVDE